MFRASSSNPKKPRSKKKATIPEEVPVRIPSPLRTPLAKERYARLEKAKIVHERAFDLPTFGELHLLRKYTATGLLPLATSNNPYDVETVRLFWVNLTVSGGRRVDSKVFTTFVHGDEISFFIHDACIKLGLSTTGVDPITTKPKEMLALAKFVLGEKWDNRPLFGKVERELLPDDLNITSFLLHHNLFPRKGNSLNEVTAFQLGIMKCIMQGKQIDFRPVLAKVFLKFTESARFLNILPLPRLVTRLLDGFVVTYPEPKHGVIPLTTLADVRRRFGSGLRRAASSSDDDDDDNDDDSDNDDNETGAPDVPPVAVPPPQFQFASGTPWSHCDLPPPPYLGLFMDYTHQWTTDFATQTTAWQQQTDTRLTTMESDIRYLRGQHESKGSPSRGHSGAHGNNDGGDTEIEWSDGDESMKD